LAFAQEKEREYLEYRKKNFPEEFEEEEEEEVVEEKTEEADDE
jgi:hypothetical protein